MVKILSSVLDSSQITRVTQGTKVPQLHTGTSPSRGVLWGQTLDCQAPCDDRECRQVPRLTRRVLLHKKKSHQGVFPVSQGDVFPARAVQPALLYLVPVPPVKILIYAPTLFPSPPPGSSIQSLHTLVDSYCPLRCHLAKLYIYLQAALLIFSHKSVPPVVWSDHPGLSLSVWTKTLLVSLTSHGCQAVSSSSELLIFLLLPISFLSCCRHCYHPACCSGPQPECYFLLCSPSSFPHPGSHCEPQSHSAAHR